MSIFVRFYQKLIAIGSALQSPLLLLLRLVWGGFFFSAGLGKFTNMEPVVGYFASLGIPFPTLSAYLASISEFGGGACLLLGLASRLAALPLMGTMIVAYATAEKSAVEAIFQDPLNVIMRSPFTFLLVSLIIFVFGPGRYAIDHLLEKRVFRKMP